MKMFYFFTKGKDEKRTYGQEYFVMSENLDEAKRALLRITHIDFKVTMKDIDEMGVSVHEKNEVVITELA